jgi:hypothetical protein
MLDHSTAADWTCSPEAPPGPPLQGLLGKLGSAAAAALLLASPLVGSALAAEPVLAEARATPVSLLGSHRRSWLRVHRTGGDGPCW